MTISRAQCRASRAWLEWTQRQLAERAAIDRSVIADFEAGRRDLPLKSAMVIEATLLEAGVVLVLDDAANGAGIQVSHVSPSASTARTEAPKSSTPGGRRIADPMGADLAADTMVALGHPFRLRLLHVLGQAGEAGMSAGSLATALEVGGSTLSHHLATLVRTGLIVQERQWKTLLYRVEAGPMTRLTEFLVDLRPPNGKR